MPVYTNPVILPIITLDPATKPDLDFEEVYTDGTA